MSRDGAEAVRAIVCQVEDVRPPQYISFGRYRMNDKGLALIAPEGKGNAQTTAFKLISGPFEILGRVRDPNGEGWARLLRWSDDDKRVHRHAISDADLHGDISALCGKLAGLGLRITTGPTRAYFVGYLNDIVVKNRVTVVTTTGWHKIGAAMVFALPDHTIGSVADEKVIESRSRESAQDDKWNFCLTAGTLCPANQERP